MGFVVGEGVPEPLGATLMAGGVNFAVHSASAEAIEVCLFDSAGEIELARLALTGRTGPVFHGHIAGVRAGDRYGLRAHGRFAPGEGLRFNPNKLLVDPYAVRLDRPYALHPSMFAYDPADPRGGAGFDRTDSAPFVPKAIVGEAMGQSPRDRPSIPWGETVIYELHVRGFTRLHLDIPEARRGTFAGLAHPSAIDHLKRLGVTTVELMPAAAWVDERHLGPLGLSNYWGYNPVSLMAPDPRLAPGGWAEVRAATDALAAAGIECVLDVVLNHSGEGDALGPSLSLRGLDNTGYYRLHPDDPARYIDDAGTGNVLALDRPAAVRLAMDALRLWRQVGGVSGFRFDLATVMGRRGDGFDPAAPLLAAIDQDPELRALKLIAEPWDIGPGGYQLGRFPAAWGEWNDRFRDTVRSAWRGDGVSLGQLAERLAGSEAEFGEGRPSRSVNFVVAHDGFTLADLVSHRGKHNEANGEGGRDGTDDNRSWNNGVEGASDDPAVRAARAGDQRALLALLLLSRGTPMLAMGDELGHSQGGNNNAYAQDNRTTWLDWARADQDLAAFAARLVQIRKAHPAFRDDAFLTGAPGEGGPWPDVDWRRPDGAMMAPADWDDPDGQSLVAVLSAGGERVALVVHRGVEPIEVSPPPSDGVWSILADSADPARAAPITSERLSVAPRSVLALADVPAPRRKPVRADPAALARLATAAGIAPEWWGVDGARRAVTPDTQRAILAALGLPAEGTRQALESLAELAGTRDRRPLPQVLVRRAGEAVVVPLRFAAAGAPPRTALRIESEDGSVRRLIADAEAGAVAPEAGRDGRPGRVLQIALPALAIGRYRVVREDAPAAVCSLTIAPPTAFTPAAQAQGRRLFGLSVQLYTLGRDRDQGVGDLTTLGQLGAAAAARGAATVAINPLHMLFEHQRDSASPYYPSDRRFLDPIYLDLEQVAGAPVDPARSARLTRQADIDYPAVWALKSTALEAAFAAAPEPPGLAGFIADGGEALETFAVFQALAEARPEPSWRDWPEELRDPNGAAVRAFAEAHPGRVRFHQYAQWLCEAQLAKAAKAASGLEIGICRDLAVGAAPDGAEAWAKAALLAQGASIGAPPDAFSADGQVWGLPPFSPLALEADGYAHVRDLLSANMRSAGALRIDHVLGLSRQFWVPEGASGADGAYVAWPFQDLLGELALESERARCLIVGEDLGTVPDGLRETLSAEEVLSYRVLPFEMDEGRFRPPWAYPPRALACVSTHDLPPLAGWWAGGEIVERRDLGLLSPEAAQAALAQRAIDKQALIDALAEAGFALPGAEAGRLTAAEVAPAIHAFIARTPSLLAVAQVEDLAGAERAVNLPGTDRERPNWRRRIATPLERLFDSFAAQAILAAIRTDRAR